MNAMTALTTKFVTFADQNTGVAYANPSSTQTAEVTFTAISSTGVKLASKSLPLLPGEHGAVNVGSFLGISSFTGLIQIVSSIPIISLSINAEAFPVVSSLPPGDLDASTPLATGDGSGGGGGQTSGTVTISALGKTSVAPFDVLTISGSGFDAQNSAISVLFLPSGNSVHMTVPAFSATSSTVQVFVPPIIDAATGGFSSATVDVQVVQVTGDSLLTSNKLPGLTITAVPAAIPSVPAGTATKIYLTVALDVLNTVKNSSNSTAAMISAINAQISAHNNLISQIDKIIRNPQATLTLTTTNGQPFVLDAATLQILDRLIISSVPQFLKLVQGITTSSSSGFRTLSFSQASVSSCGLETLGNPVLDEQYCEFRHYEQTKAQKTKEVVQAGAKWEIGIYLTLLGGWAASGFASAGVITERAAHGFALLWDITSSYIASNVTASPPPQLSEAVAGVVSKVVDTHLFWGLPIADSAVKATQLLLETSKITSGTPTDSPKSGITLAAPKGLTSAAGQEPDFSYRGCPLTAAVRGAVFVPMSFSAATAASCGTGDSAVVDKIAVPPTQQDKALADAVEPPPDARQFDGSYSGSFSGIATDEGGSEPVSGSVAFTASSGTITVTSPGSGSGALTATGVITIGGLSVEGASCTFGGRFQLSSSNQATAGGGWSCTFSGGSASGFWNASR